ncbi:MAG: hypothetical protein U0270_30550 [Labilithrix sp.]
MIRSTVIVPLGFAFAFATLLHCTDYGSTEDPVADAAAPDGSSSGASSTSGASGSSSSGDAATSSTSSSSSGSSTAYPPPCDPQVDFNNLDCTTSKRSICASELPSVPKGLEPTDLIECDSEGTATCVRHCAMGCASVNGSTPSQCANCPDKTATDIWYCGKDIGFAVEARDIVIHCSSGALASASESSASCGEDRCHTVCTRTTPPPLPGSCCQQDPEAP